MRNTAPAAASESTGEGWAGVVSDESNAGHPSTGIATTSGSGGEAGGDGRRTKGGLDCQDHQPRDDDDDNNNNNKESRSSSTPASKARHFLRSTFFARQYSIPT